jgi:hypothetical protein
MKNPWQPRISVSPTQSSGLIGQALDFPGSRGDRLIVGSQDITFSTSLLRVTFSVY